MMADKRSESVEGGCSDKRERMTAVIECTSEMRIENPREVPRDDERVKRARVVERGGKEDEEMWIVVGLIWFAAEAKTRRTTWQSAWFNWSSAWRTRMAE